MWKMLQQKNPEDFVIASGKSYTVLDLVKKSFSLVDLDWKKHVKIDKKLYRILEVDKLEGDSKKAQKSLGWTPKTNFNELIEIMVESDIERWKQWKNGKFFPWDAINSLDEYKTITRHTTRNF
jgi:GDPmannose 4,6-dehydratase